MKPILLILALFISGKAFSQDIVKLTNPSALATPKGYSQAAVLDLGNAKMIIMSGQIALDKQGNLVGKNDLEKQTEQVFKNIQSIVESSGGTMDNVVKLGYFITDVSKVSVVRTVRDKFVNLTAPPASTLVEVSKLFREDILIEIEATAIIPTRRL